MMLTRSRHCVAPTASTPTGRKWSPSAAAQQAKSALKHEDIVGIGEETSALGRAEHPGTKQLHLSAAALWLRRYDGKAGDEVCKGCLSQRAHPGWLQDNPHSRPVHLAAQPGAQVTSWFSRDQEDICQCSTSSITLSYICNRVCP